MYHYLIVSRSARPIFRIATHTPQPFLVVVLAGGLGRLTVALYQQVMGCELGQSAERCQTWAVDRLTSKCAVSSG